MKLIDARRDHYRKLAHYEGYRSRSAYKLKELNKSYRILGSGFYVLDIGCAPGGWMQVAHQSVGNKGKVIGIDPSYVEDIPGTSFIKASVEDESVVEEVFSNLGRKVNAVISDLSPKISGNWSVDHAHQISLNYSATKIMEKVLAPKGNALFKIFDGPYSSEFYQYLKRQFSKVKMTKPLVSKKSSSEVYCVCLGFLG